jgi:hypothetical protein
MVVRQSIDDGDALSASRDCYWIVYCAVKLGDCCCASARDDIKLDSFSTIFSTTFVFDIDCEQ